MKLRLHQIYYHPGQVLDLDEDMIPYDNSGSDLPDTYEFYVFRKEYLANKIEADAYTGFVSWKFCAKTGISAKKFIEFCQKNPGYDAYFVNPFPIEIHAGNVWRQGDLYHPGMPDLAKKLLVQTGYDVSLGELPASLRTTSYCNYWIGNKKFWDRYMTFCLPIWDYIFKDLSEKERGQLFTRRDLRTGSSYFAFIFERLFTTFILTHPDIRTLSYKYSASELAQKYSSKAAHLVSEVQEMEARLPNDPYPLLRNPTLLAALKQYGDSQNQWRIRPLPFVLMRWIWLRVPFRLAVQRTKGGHWLYDRMRSVRRSGG